MSKGFNGRLNKQDMAQFGSKNFSKTSDAVEDNEDYAKLFSIGVSPTTQSKGVGEMLLVDNECVM